MESEASRPEWRGFSVAELARQRIQVPVNSFGNAVMRVVRFVWRGMPGTVLRGMRIGEGAHPGPGRDSRRRRRVSSSDDEGGSDDAPLVPPTVVDDVECTQWESGASFSLPSRSLEFFSTRTPVFLSNRFTALEDDRPGPQLHVLSEGTCSTESDTESVACEPRIRRRRLSLVWDADLVSHPANGRGEVMPDSHDERLARVRQLMQEEVGRGQHEESAATLVDPMASRRVVLVPQSGTPQSTMDRRTQESSPANEPRVSPIEEGVEREVPPGITVEHLADSEDMLDTPRAPRNTKSC